MKIAVVSHLYPSVLNPYQGKFIQDHFNLLKEEQDMNIQLAVPTPYPLPFTQKWKENLAELSGKDDSMERVFYLSFPKKKFPGIIQASASKKITDFLNNHPVKFDLVHIHWLYPDGLIIPALSRSPDSFKTILTVHGSDWYKNIMKPELTGLLKESLIHATLILCSGPKLKHDIQQTFPELTDKLKVIYNYVDSLAYPLPEAHQKKKAKLQLNWDPEKKQALTVANLRHEKGIDVLLEAILGSGLENETDFHIIGKNSGDDYAAGVVQFVKEKNLSNVYFHDPVPPQHLKKFYHAADLFVLPSRSEGFNVSILEATASGLPVVCTDAGGNHEVIKDEIGILTDTEAPLQLREAIWQVVQELDNFNPETIRKYIIDQYGDQKFKERLREHYSTVTLI